MRLLLRVTARVAVLGLAAMTMPTASPTPIVADATVANGEVRIRKLHLVRPDLIPYPVYFEVVC